MGSSEAAPKDFQRAASLLPLTTPGVSSLEEFQDREHVSNRLEQLKRSGLSDDEIQLYHDKEEGMERVKMENRVLREKLQYIYSKLEAARECERQQELKDSHDDAKPSTSGDDAERPLDNLEKKPATYYPDHHPMNSIKEMEKDLFDHIQVDEIAPINKRRKILRRLHRKQEAVGYDASKFGVQNVPVAGANQNPNSLWDIKEVPKRVTQVPKEVPKRVTQVPRERENSVQNEDDCNSRKRLIGPRPQVQYTIKDQKIVRLEPIANCEGGGAERQFHAVDIVVPVNDAEERLLEGTKLSIDQIRSMDRFKDYQPGRPSKVLFLKNIAPAASGDDISILFNQFVHENRAPVHVRLMTGRLRGQAFVHFQHENVAIQALEDVNGTVVKGRPVIAQFGKNSNNLQQGDR